MSTSTNPFDRLTEGQAMMRLDAAALRRVGVMLRSQGWRDVLAWLRGLERDLSRCADVEAIVALAARIEGGAR
jgi:hypothetical protein